MSRVQLALRVGDLESSIAFYTKLFDTEPAKRRPGYANFAISTPALKLVLLQGEPGQDTVMDHLGIEVGSTDQVDAASRRLTGEGMETLVEKDTTCCYAEQDKVWVHGPGQEPWEVYTVTGDSASFGHDSPATAGTAACGTSDAGPGAAAAETQTDGSCC
ncbi:ArsI/CadI family heavy metal resistance metalloenzyme [Actinoalloteichus hymeniacidonis]|uniref:Lactoylglutathione lyase-like lyase n=1 Tax=Actinoalloteichus hymeniacidonis TaxID=340345 RepID=A0AAC9HRD3_9PSEU|nr:ArsI/CadI family heavy metal resistance metalloenzyme [Actinoalloteichus hymeniacidonis]AOS64242.1 lactoylglutathione lyase-like lyase [Actinoalloteichus hymeniacidonis]MBB5907690.1 catechol 2,3-dioxygenase-like lactoylglutathione lyase family enzyme [Actinoalloteichus hymeniacidonis]